MGITFIPTDFTGKLRLTFVQMKFISSSLCRIVRTVRLFVSMVLSILRR
uniref:Uncharacterized protein n=1 Tax=Pseudomonas phage RVTF4 TaxID=3236931 RepID=A0AB39CD25_9VIRU